VLADGPPIEVLNHYQKTVMEREQAFEEEAAAAGDEPQGGDDAESFAPLRYNYRHGDGSAEIVSAELLDASRRPVGVVETGSPLMVRVRARFQREVDDAVFGFLVNDSRGVHAYGTNTKEQQIDFGLLRRGELVEVSFAFDCWLGLDQFSVSLAVHSRDGVSYDWLDGVLFFRVTSPVLVEGIANLNATASARRLESRSADFGMRIEAEARP
jgi:hypothetical protein